MRGEVGVHPADDVAFFHVEVMLVVIVLEDHLRQDAIDLHDPQGAANLDTTVFNLEVGILGALAGIHLFHVALEGLGAVGMVGDPYLVSVEVPRDAHEGVVGQGVLGDQVDVLTNACRVDHVGRYEPTRVGAAEEDGIRGHIFGEIRVRQGLLFRVEFFADGLRPAELVVPELPAEIMPVLLGPTRFSDQLAVTGVLLERDQAKGQRHDHAHMTNGGILASDGADERQAKNQAVADPEGVQGMRGDELHALDEVILDIPLGVGQDDQHDTHGQEPQQRGNDPALRIEIDHDFEAAAAAHQYNQDGHKGDGAADQQDQSGAL